jgi:hypothetical protein
MATVRTKFQCKRISQEPHWNGTDVIYVYYFEGVTAAGDPENETYFENFPGGSFTIQSTDPLAYEVWEYRYIDIIDPVAP